MPIRTGAAFLDSLRDGRQVWLNGERVDVTTHPDLAGCARALAAVYDLQHAPGYHEQLTMPSPSSGAPVSLAYLLPRSTEDLVRKRQMTELLMRHSGALLGRLPEYMALILLGLYDVRAILAEAHPSFGENVAAYFEHCRENDLCLSHSFVDPPRDQGRPATDVPYLRIVEERADGIVVSGAKGVATLAPYADELVCLTLGRRDIPPEEVLHCAIPLASPGVAIVCREPLAPRRPADHPVAAAYDEMDAWVILRDVFVPHERVFYRWHGDRLASLHRQVLAWAYFHILVRLAVKAEVLLGLATAIADHLGTAQRPHVQAGLCDLICYVETLRALIQAAERDPVPSASGLAVPNPTQVLAGRVLAVEREPQMLQVLREVCSAGILMAPGQAELTHPELRPDVERYLIGNDERATARFRLLKLAWDYAADSFGSRQLLFDMFNARDLQSNKLTLTSIYDASAAVDLARHLAGLDAPAPPPG